MENTSKELDIIRNNSKELEEQIKNLKKNVDNFEKVHENLMSQTSNLNETEFKKLREKNKLIEIENDKLKVSSANDKDSLLIKNKIIEDQQETIKQLKEKCEKIKSVTTKNQSLERIIDLERAEKLELQDALEV